MIGNGKFEPLTLWNDIELKYRITASKQTSQTQNISEKMKKAKKIFFEGHIKDQIAKNDFL